MCSEVQKTFFSQDETLIQCPAAMVSAIVYTFGHLQDLCQSDADPHLSGNNKSCHLF